MYELAIVSSRMTVNGISALITVLRGSASASGPSRPSKPLTSLRFFNKTAIPSAWPACAASPFANPVASSSS